MLKFTWWALRGGSRPFKAASGTGANISQPGSLFLQPVLGIEPGPPKWFANTLTVRPWRRSWRCDEM